MYGSFSGKTQQPSEEGAVTISRAAGTMTYPADVMLVGAMNPCPCGFYGDLKRECRCSAPQVQRYRQRISGPLLDRIDIHLEVAAVPYQELAATQPAESSSAIRARVLAARARQQARFAATPSIRCNARMTSKALKAYCRLDETGSDLLRMAMSEFHLSARAHDRILKVARTIADLEEADAISPLHLSEAIQYRTLDRNLWV
jgi:magnesium chelatase family protein